MCRWLTKQIMMSQVYRQSSSEVEACLKADPSAKLLWRKPPLRLEAEAIRDALLQISGLLDEKMFGPPEPIKRGSDGQWLEDGEKGSANRRSLYLSQARTRPVAFLHAFDAPAMTSDNQSQRFRSALPAQSLALLNSPLVMRATNAFAGQLLERTRGNIGEALAQAFAAAYSRPATPRELDIARKAMQEESDQKEGLRLFLQALIGANDFLYTY